MAGQVKHQTIMYGFNTGSATKFTTVLWFRHDQGGADLVRHPRYVVFFTSYPNRLGWGTSSGILFLIPLTAGDFVGPLLGYIRHNSLRFGDWMGTLRKVSHPGPSLLAMLALMTEIEQPQCYAVRNGDLGLSKETEKLDLTTTAVLTAYNILLFATTGPDSEKSRFVHDPLRTEKDGCYHGFHVEDWFRAIYAMKFFNDRRRKNPIDVAAGQFPEPVNGYTLYSKSELEPLDVEEDWEYDEDVDPEHTSGMEDPAQFQQMLDTADQFFADHYAEEQRGDEVESEPASEDDEVEDYDMGLGQ